MHEGRPILRHSSYGTLVLCPLGHVLTFQSAKDWGGSWLEAHATDSKWRVVCDGALPGGEA